MPQLTATRLRANRVLAGILGGVAAASAVGLTIGFAVWGFDLVGLALVIGSATLAYPSLLYARGVMRPFETMPRSLIVVSYAYWIIAALALAVFGVNAVVEYRHAEAFLYFGMFGFIWALLIFGVIVLPGWAIVFASSRVIQRAQARTSTDV